MTTEPDAGGRGLPVRTRIAVAVAVLTGLALAGAGLVVYALESARIDRAAAAIADREIAEFASFQRTAPADARVDDTPGQALSGVAAVITDYLAQNLPADNEMLVGYWDGAAKRRQGSAHPQLTVEPAFRDAVLARLDRGGATTMDSPWGEVAVTVQPVRGEAGSDPPREGALVVAVFLAAEHAELREVMRTYAIVSVLSLGLIAAAASWQANRLLRPLRELRVTARQITETDLSRRIPETGHDDITALSRTFNQMLARLDSAFTGQRRFLDAAGHELRTPLTVLRGHLELLDTEDRTDVEATRVLLLDEADRMSRLVEDLMVLAKADRPDFVRLAPVPTGPLLDRVLEKCRGLGSREWTCVQAVDVPAELDEQRVTQALLQLAANAVAHTRDGDRISLGSELRDGVLRLWVEDTGPGVPDAEKADVFERFVRGTRARGEHGFGLGLSIVRAIAQAHDGTAHVEDVASGGARFVLALPVRRKGRS
jgi:two-component system, OmpR family, sensor kinase